MVILEELWIGDRLYVQSLNKVGLFEGVTADGLVILKIEDNIIHVEAKYLSMAPDEKPDEDLGLTTTITPQISSDLENALHKGEIDLHIEVLNPSLLTARVERILQYQIEQCSKFIREAIIRRKIGIKIIHGKGAGVLKLEVEHVLNNNDNVLHYSTVNNGGAQEVLFNY